MTADLESERVSWPAAHRAALIVVFRVDAPDAGPGGTYTPGPEYTADGLSRLFRIFGDLDLAATTAWTSRALAAYPTLVRSAAEQGHEVAIVLQPGENATSIAARATHLSAHRVVGTIVELQIGSGAIADTLLDESLWIATGLSGDNAVLVPREHGKPIVSIPLSPYWTDAIWLGTDRPHPPSSFLEVLSTALAAVRAEGGLMTVQVHPQIIGRPGFVATLVRFLDEVIASGDVWIARADQVAGWTHESREAPAP